jgi:hypothetical protein
MRLRQRSFLLSTTDWLHLAYRSNFLERSRVRNEQRSVSSPSPVPDAKYRVNTKPGLFYCSRRPCEFLA